MRTLVGRSAIIGHGSVHPKTVGRLLCGSWISRVVMDSKGVVLDLGRRQRLFNAAQRRAIIIRDEVCAWGNCTVPAERCHIHHENYWEHGGATDLDNGRPYCSRHHHCLHEGGWTVRRSPDGTRWATHPDRPHPIRC